MQLTQGWKQIELIEKSPFNKEPIQGKGKLIDADSPDQVVYFSNLATPIDGKFFIKEEQIIAYE